MSCSEGDKAAADTVGQLTVRPAGYFDVDCILDAIHMANQTPDIKLGYRGLLSKTLYLVLPNYYAA